MRHLFKAGSENLLKHNTRTVFINFGKTTQKKSPPIHTPQNQPHNTPHRQFHSLHHLHHEHRTQHVHHENRSQHQNFNHCYTVHFQHSYAELSHYPHHSYTCHSHHYYHHYHEHHHPHHFHHYNHHHRNDDHHHHTNTNPIPYGPRHPSPTQTPHTLIVINHSLGIIPTTLCHLSPDVAGASAIGALGDSRTRRTTATQGSHHHLAILKT